MKGDGDFSGADVRPFVDGELRSTTSDERVEVLNPSNGASLYDFGAGSAADVDQAVQSARRSFGEGVWRLGAPSWRKSVLLRFAELIASQARVLDEMDAADMGKPVSEPLANASAAAAITRFYGEAIDKVAGDVRTSDKDSLVLQRFVPRGVVGAITPWNFPTVNAVRKIAPALAAGNSIVLKPSELSPRSAMRLACLAIEAGLPPGVLNITPGLGQTVGMAIGLHEQIDMVTFTGSTATGKRVLEYAARSNMKVVLAECGGKSPHVVFDDGVDLAAAAQSIARFILTNQGQICTVGSRVLVHRNAEPELVERIKAHLQEAVIGDALDPRTTFGPLVSERQCEKVMSYIEGAEHEGAQRVSGGRRVHVDSGGWFVEPALFRNVRPDARIAQEEIFGPVLSITCFDSEEEAIRLANGTIYGLMAYVWTNDLSRAMRVSKAINSSVRVNATARMGEGAGQAFSIEPAAQSGVGIETGIAGMESYMRRQQIAFHHA